MNKFVFRVTLTSPLGSLVVPQPDGLEEAPFTLARDKTYKSVLEGFDSTLTFNLEAIAFIDAAKALGLDTELSQVIEISADYGVTWEPYVSGLLDLPSQKTTSSPRNYLIDLAAKKDSVWSKMESRREVDVNVIATEDLDGAAVAAATVIDVLLTTQVARRQLRMEMEKSTDDDFVDQIFQFTPTDDRSTLQLPKSVYEEIATTYHYPNLAGPSPGVGLPMIEMAESATLYDFDISIVLAAGPAYDYKMPADFIHPISVVWAPSDGGGPRPPPFYLGRTDYGTDGVDGHSVFTATFTIDPLAFPMPRPPYADRKVFKIGDMIFVTIGNPSVTDPTLDVYIVPDDIYDEKSFINIIAHTIYPPSSTKAIRIGENFDAIVKRITGGDNFYSDFFSTGCGKNFVSMLGLHLRGYGFDTKPFTDNLLACFRDADAVWNLGLGYEKVAGVLKIRVEEILHFYDLSGNSIELSNIETIESSFKEDAASNAIEIGYSKWQLTSGGSLIDDIQTQHTYSDPFKYVGKKITVFCNRIAAALLFELTRRSKEKLNETFDTDNDKFLLAINDADEAKLDYVGAAGLFDAEQRYNKEITPGRNFLRWIKNFNIGAYQYIGEFFKFVTGLGNYLAIIEIDPSTCEGSNVASVTENADIEITADVLHGIEVITFIHDLNWEQYKLIRDSPHKTIGISQTGADHVPYFIEKIDFILFHKKANFTLVATKPYVVAGECDIISQSVQNVGGNYNVNWQGVDVPLTGIDTETGTTTIVNGAVTAVATKTTDGGLVVAASAIVEFKVNGILKNTQTFLVGVPLDATYTFTFVQLTDTLEVFIVEFDV